MLKWCCNKYLFQISSSEEDGLTIFQRSLISPTSDDDEMYNEELDRVDSPGNKNQWNHSENKPKSDRISEIQSCTDTDMLSAFERMDRELTMRSDTAIESIIGESPPRAKRNNWVSDDMEKGDQLGTNKKMKGHQLGTSEKPDRPLSMIICCRNNLFCLISLNGNIRQKTNNFTALWPEAYTLWLFMLCDINKINFEQFLLLQKM